MLLEQTFPPIVMKVVVKGRGYKTSFSLRTITVKVYSIPNSSVPAGIVRLLSVFLSLALVRKALTIACAVEFVLFET